MNQTVLEEWLSPASLTYIVKCLQACQTSEMVSDLRSFIPREALRAATERLPQAKREQIKNWVVNQNSRKEVAA